MSWSGFLSGLGDIAGSSLGSSVIGAGAGYGIDRLSGGDGRTGAIVGGAAGLANSLSGGNIGSNLVGEGTSNFGSTFLGNLTGFGEAAGAGTAGMSMAPASASDYWMGGVGTTTGTSGLAGSSQNIFSATNPAFTNNSSSIGSQLSDYVKGAFTSSGTDALGRPLQSTGSQIFDTGLKGAGVYTDYTSGKAASKRADQEMALNNMHRISELNMSMDAYNRAKEAQDEKDKRFDVTDQGAQDAFSNSSLANMYRV